MEVFEPHIGQLEVIRSNSRFRMVNCGRRWGKTTLAINEMLAFASLKPNSLVVYFAPTFGQARDIAWRMLKNNAPMYGQVKTVNETRLEIKINDSEIWLRGVENYESARGLGIHFLVVDELAMMRNWYNVWEEVLRATLADTQGQALFCSTPKGFNHWYELWKKGQDNVDGYQSWTFPSITNPFLKPEEIDKAKQELRDEAFEQEWMAQFRSTVGLAHPDFDRAIHFIEPFDIPLNWGRARGFDYGLVDFTASVRVAIDQDNWFIDSCYLDNHSSVKEHAEAIRAQDYNLGFVPCWGDPSGKQWVEEFAMHNLHIQNANKTVGQGSRGWVEFCVEKVNERLKPIPGHTVYLPDGRKIENAPRLFILKNGKTDKLVSQIERLSWRSTSTGEFVPTLEDTGDPTGGHYDLLAALRYLCVSYQKENNSDMVLPDDTQWFKDLWH